jgi:hypothetical protein
LASCFAINLFESLFSSRLHGGIPFCSCETRDVTMWGSTDYKSEFLTNLIKVGTYNTNQGGTGISQRDHFLFNLLRIKGLYMFRALLAHAQEALHKRHFIHCVRRSSQLTYARNIPSAVCVTPPKDEQIMLETFRGPSFLIN